MSIIYVSNLSMNSQNHAKKLLPGPLFKDSAHCDTRMESDGDRSTKQLSVLPLTLPHNHLVILIILCPLAAWMFVIYVMSIIYYIKHTARYGHSLYLLLLYHGKSISYIVSKYTVL